MSSHGLSMAPPHPSHRCPGFITDLILRCAQGDETALGHLFDLLHPLVGSLVVQGGACAAGDALIVAAFKRLWSNASTYDPKTQGPVAWVMGQISGVPDLQPAA